MSQTSPGSNEQDLDDLVNLDVDEAKARDVAPTRDAEKLAAATRDPHPSPDIPKESLNGSVNSPAFLTSLVKWHPAIGSFQFLADCSYPKSMPADQRFTNLAERWKLLMWICIVVDFIVMLAVLAGLAVIACRVIQMTLFA